MSDETPDLSGFTVATPVPNLPSVPTLANLPDKPTLNLSPTDVARLAREIVQNIRDLPVILKDYNLTDAQYGVLQQNTYFQQALKTLAIEWNSAESTEKRIRLGAAAIMEDSLPTLGAKMVSAREALRDQVEAGKLFAKLAGVGDGPPAGGGEKFQINIQIGETKLQYEKNVSPTLQLESEGSGEAA